MGGFSPTPKKPRPRTSPGGTTGKGEGLVKMGGVRQGTASTPRKRGWVWKRRSVCDSWQTVAWCPHK